ncbi:MULTISPECIES: efflux RND transporter periplasmic adaptor subunit [Methylotenera]|uniref:efflux RND transporter periplasmic adaptor subunit n=1 Tax=Methylotenera TaxID=359407 RepID=UPI001E2AE66F|nr:MULTISPECIES: efflux RND transporter periplasmic adaptor subunit [Methylotenera]
MKKYPAIRFYVFLNLCISLAFLMAGCKQSASEPKTKVETVPEVGVVTVKLQAQSIVTELPGRTVARMIAEIRPQVGGIIQKRAFVEGANVKTGDLLYQIDPAVYRAVYDSAQANVKKSEANLASLKSKAERYAELVKINAVSKQDNDDINALFKQGEADLLLTQAALQTARINLNFTRIIAPISGRVDVSAVTPGALVTANQDVVLTRIQQLDPIFVDITQSSNELLRLKRDMASGDLKKASTSEAPIKVILEDGSVYSHEGILKFSGVTVNPTSGAVTLRAIVPNNEGLLLPGMYVRARIREAVDEHAIVVPQQSVSRNAQGEATVLVVNNQSKVEVRIIAADKSIGNQWLVTEGLVAGEQVIVDGMQKASVGDKVKAIEMAAASSASTKINRPVTPSNP